MTDPATRKRHARGGTMIRRIADRMTTIAIGLVLAGAVWNIGAALQVLDR